MGDLLAVADAGGSSIDRAWFASFALAAVTLVAVHFFAPGARGLAIGKDKRLSTSRVQVLVWTYAVLFALLALFFAFLIVVVFADLFGEPWADRLRNPIGGRFEDFLKDGVDETYLLLLGFPLGAAVTAKGITSTKVADGSIVKTEKKPTDETSGVSELVSDDDGNADLGDFQYVLFNFLAVAYFLAQFMAHPGNGLPDMPDTLVGLTGIAAAAYVTKKGVYREPPILLGVLPPAAAHDATIKVYGERLLGPPLPADGAAPPERTTMVVIGGRPAVQEGDATDEVVSVKVPAGLATGATKIRIIRPPGAQSEELPFDVLEQ